jgi:hypothetical protein
VRRIAIALTLALLVGAATGVLVFRSQPARTDLCAGVGLVTDTKADSPDEALRAYVVSRGGDPATWKRVDGFGGHSYRPKNPERAVPDLTEIQVERDGGSWRASGACV